MHFYNKKSLSLSEVLPAYTTAGGEACPVFDCNYGNSGVSILGTCASEFEAYRHALTEAGATLYAENQIANNSFVTYLLPYDGSTYAVHIMYYPVTCNVRVIWGERGFLPHTDPVVRSAGSGRTSVLQHKRNGVFNKRPETGAPGMGYIVTLADGSSILIDGGPRQYEEHFTGTFENGEWVEGDRDAENDCDKLYRLLCERTPGDKKPVIAAWFFTHAHSDHVDLACDFLAKYKDAVTVRLGAYNFPDFVATPVKNERLENLQPRAELVAKRIADMGAEAWILHTGEKMDFPGCEVEILATPEDYSPKSFAWCNHTSTAFRMTFSGKSFLVLGDVEKDICQLMADKFGKELKSDILQLTHHGFNGACHSLYPLVDPEVCLWPTDVYRFHMDPRQTGTQRGYEFNAWLRNDEIRRRKHYHSSEDIEIFTDEK